MLTVDVWGSYEWVCLGLVASLLRRCGFDIESIAWWIAPNAVLKGAMLTSTTPIQLATPIDLGLQGHKLESFVKNITEYKGQLDASLVALRKGKATPDERAWLLEQGFVKEKTSGNGVATDTFAAWVLGPFRIRASYKEDRPTALFPGWAAIGWNRNQYAKVNLEDAKLIKASLDKRTLDPSESDGWATWFKPLPVIVTGEGKHRADLHRQHKLDMLARVRIDTFPGAESLELVRIHWASDEWALRCLDVNAFGAGGRFQDDLVYLPLPQLSVPLLQAYGVQTCSRKCWPWQVSLGLRDSPRDAPFGLKWQPKKWRSVVLSEGYI